MTSDDQHFLDILSGISKDIRNFTVDLADATDRHFESVAAAVKQTLSTASWLPPGARPSPPPSPPPSTSLSPASLLERTQDWASHHRALTAAILAFAGTTAVLWYRQSRRYHRRRRKARRAGSGARCEVVVVWGGTAGSPVARSVALDLERRGFVVYVVCTTEGEGEVVRGEGRADVRPLILDIVDPASTHDAISRFAQTFSRTHLAFPGSVPHTLRLAGLILAPDPSSLPRGPVAAIPPNLWADALNTKVLATIAVAQAFLPLLTSPIYPQTTTSSTNSSTTSSSPTRSSPPRVLLLTPAIVPALHPPFHAPEATVSSALRGFADTLRRELDPLGVRVCHLRLGTFDFSSPSFLSSSSSPSSSSSNSSAGPKPGSWPPSARAHYGPSFVAQSRAGAGRGKGSAPRELHDAVAEALMGKTPKSVVRVGRGSWAYEVVGSWAPEGLVGWMMGARMGARRGAGWAGGDGVVAGVGGAGDGVGGDGGGEMELWEPRVGESSQAWEKVDGAVKENEAGWR